MSAFCTSGRTVSGHYWATRVPKIQAGLHDEDTGFSFRGMTRSLKIVPARLPGCTDIFFKQVDAVQIILHFLYPVSVYGAEHYAGI